jgi:hypothetical protein
MVLELVDESDIKKPDKKHGRLLAYVPDDDVVKDVEVTEKIGIVETKRKLEFVPKEDAIECERRRIGMTDNCVLCQASNKEIFGRCPNKWGS